MEKVDRKTLAHSYSRRGVFAESSTSSLPARPSLLRIAVEDIVHMAPSADLSLPPGGGFCIDTVSGPQNLVCFSLSLSLSLFIPVLVVSSANQILFCIIFQSYQDFLLENIGQILLLFWGVLIYFSVFQKVLLQNSLGCSSRVIVLDPSSMCNWWKKRGAWSISNFGCGHYWWSMCRCWGCYAWMGTDSRNMGCSGCMGGCCAVGVYHLCPG